jgi:hypoxanthine phosphoribosyltransferase
MWDYHLQFLGEEGYVRYFWVKLSFQEQLDCIIELGAQISQDYQGKNLLLICILRGGVMFLTDLMRHIRFPHAIEFMAVSSYGAGERETTGQVRITLDLNTTIQDRDVILVEDIVDSGRTISLGARSAFHAPPAQPVRLRLLDKEERREVPIPVRYRGL